MNQNKHKPFWCEPLGFFIVLFSLNLLKTCSGGFTNFEFSAKIKDQISFMLFLKKLRND
jgi:hypothetical protein